MPHDRRTGRLCLAMTGLVGVAMSVGCLRSNLQTPTGPLPDLSPAGDLQAVPAGKGPGPNVPSPTSTPAPSADEGAAPTPRPTYDSGPGRTESSASPSASSPAPGADIPAAETDPAIPAASPAGERPTTPAALPTPLLDAEIRRAQAVNLQHIESLRAIDAPPPAVHPADAPTDEPPASREPATAGAARSDDADPEVVAPLPLAASPRPVGSASLATVPSFIPVDSGAVAAASPPTVPPPPRLPAADRKPPAEPADAPADRRKDDPRDDEKVDPDVRDDAGRDARPAVADSTPTAPAPTAERPPLEIAALRLCSRVHGFGAFQAMDAEPFKSGQEALVYCEMTGLEYQALGDEFVSRLAAHVEIRSGADGSIVWEQGLKTARDVCRRPRHDYYVSYRIRFPGNLEPGSYRLRLIQTDLFSNRATSRDIPVRFER